MINDQRGKAQFAPSSRAGYLVPFLFVLTIIVFFHELGHFLVARLCGVGVTAFSPMAVTLTR